MDSSDNRSRSNSEKDPTTVSEFYDGKTVVLTGGTGFLGQAIIEKLLRTCPGIKELIILVRSKKNVSPEKRIEDLATLPAFTVLRETDPHFVSKMTCMACDLGTPGLGLSKEDRIKLIRECNVFIHCAATLKFTEHLRLAFELNVQCVRKIVDLCHQMYRLFAFVHISTAYSNCDIHDIDEKIYDPPIDYIELERTLKWMDDESIADITPRLLGKRPNTYTFTKALAEDAIGREGGNLPVCIVRPSMIISAFEEPLPGWCANSHGPTAFTAAYLKGLLRSMLADPRITADLVPVDLVVNGIVVSSFKTAQEHIERRRSLGYNSGAEDYFSGSSTSEESISRRISKKKLQHQNKNVPVYTINTSNLNPLYIPNFVKYGTHWAKEYPCTVLRNPKVTIRQNRLTHDVSVFLEQTIPAKMIDVILKLMNQKFRMSIINDKIIAGNDAFEYFYTNTFSWNIDNTLKLFDGLSEKDKQIYNIRADKYHWYDYMKPYVIGVGKYILKEKHGDYSKPKRSLKIARIVEHSFNAALVLGLVGVASSCGLASYMWDLTSSIFGDVTIGFMS